MTKMKRCKSKYDPSGTATPCVRASGHKGSHSSSASTWEDPSSGDPLLGGRVYRMKWSKPNGSTLFVKARTSEGK
jgi:hypothetical protein